MSEETTLEQKMTQNHYHSANWERPLGGIMSIIKIKGFNDMAKSLKLGAQIEQIDTIVNLLTKRKHRLLKRMGFGKNGESVTKKEEK